MWNLGSMRSFKHKDRWWRVGVLKGTNQIKAVGFSDELLGRELKYELSDDVRKRIFDGASVAIDADVIESHFADDLPTVDIDGVTIFVAGTWTDSRGRKKTYTESDLDEMVRNSIELKDKVQPFVKLMHLSPKDHLAVTAKPALGWARNLRRVGNKLVADFKKVPRKIGQLMEAGTFRRVSSEIFNRWLDESTGTVYKNVVSAVGLLGAVHPAVSTVDDVMKLFGMGDGDVVPTEPIDIDDWAECYGGAAAFYEAEFHEENKSPEGGDNMLTKDQMAELKADLKEELAGEFKADLSKAAAEFQTKLREDLGIDADADIVKTFKELRDDKTSANDELGKRERKDFEAKVTEQIDAAKKAGKIAPSQEPGLKLMVDSWAEKADDTGKFSIALDDDNEVEGTVLECLEAYLKTLPVVHEYEKEHGKMKTKTTKKAVALPLSVRRQLGTTAVPMTVTGTNVNAQVLNYQSEHKCDFMSAFEAVTGCTPAAAPEVGEYSIDNNDEMHRS